MRDSVALMLCGIGLALVLSDRAGAQAIGESPERADSTLASAGSDLEELPGIKSGTSALLLSALGTATAAACAPLVFESNGPEVAGFVLVGALVLGPALGHFYAERPGPALAGIGIRLLAGAGVAYGALSEGSEAGATSTSNAIAAAGVIVGGASILWDIARAPHSARVHNDQVRQSRLSFGITPSAGAPGMGLSVAVRF
jgi:hypothetical protein